MLWKSRPPPKIHTSFFAASRMAPTASAVTSGTIVTFGSSS
jgi:hypothetical protein